jgi:predicted nucleic acid-binding protein
LLSSLADVVRIPQQVMEEIAAGAQNDEAAAIVRDFAEARLVMDIQIPDRIRQWDLGPGESQVLPHAWAGQELEAVLDDRAARRCARVMGIASIGTLGIVLACRRANIIPAARPLIESLVEQGIWLAPDLIAESLAEVGE